ncbi:MAG: DUF4012 domain-containing protein [Candidatus Kerfeldbacteria bacterium]|nr:DUF4012 domain-containing protein [Candidatus Kerfeldbacteria bacterium]
MKQKKTKIDVIQNRFHVPEENILDLRKKQQENVGAKERSRTFFSRLFTPRKRAAVQAEEEIQDEVPDVVEETAAPESAQEYFITEFEEEAPEEQPRIAGQPEQLETENDALLLLDEPREGEDDESQFTPEYPVAPVPLRTRVQPRTAIHLRMPRVHLPSFELSRNARPLIGFALMCLLLIAPVYAFGFYAKAKGVRGRVLGTSEIAVAHLREAADSTSGVDFSSARDELNTAMQLFDEAQGELAEISGLLKVVPVKGGEVAAVEALLTAGEQVALAGQFLSKALAPVSGKEGGGDAAGERATLDIGSALLLMNTNLQPALQALERANAAIQNVDADLVPENTRAQFVTVQSELPELLSQAASLADLVDLIATIVGHENEQRIMFLFQNNEERRPTGGFIGSVGVLEIENGRVANIDVPAGGTYDIDGQLKELVLPPPQLLLVTTTWALRDSNWFPDFPESAKKAVWFYEHSLNGGETVDEVVAFTPDVIKKFLEITGPIEIPETDITIRAESVIAEIERQKEAALETTPTTPKDFIQTLTPLLLERVFSVSSDQIGDVLLAFDEVLREKHMLMYFADEKVESRIRERGWGGEMLPAPADYLMVNMANISGGKTDGVIDDSFALNVDVADDGTVVNTLRVTRTHNGTSADGDRGIKNTSYVRVYVPEGSTLLSADGFDQPDPRLFLYPEGEAEADADLERVQGRVVVDEATGVRMNSEFGKTVFGNWFAVEPGASRSFVIQYRLPLTVELKGLFSKSASYSLLAEKQSGTEGAALHVTMHLPQNARVISRYPEDESLVRENDVIRFDSTLNVNRFFGLVLQE